MPSPLNSQKPLENKHLNEENKGVAAKQVFQELEQELTFNIRNETEQTENNDSNAEKKMKGTEASTQKIAVNTISPDAGEQTIKQPSIGTEAGQELVGEISENIRTM